MSALVLGCIADDFTGATDLANNLVRSGMRTVQTIGVPAGSLGEEVDAVVVGTDRVTANGDVCNKIGTYLKALAAADNDVPFYVALPYTTFDPNTESGADIPIEERSAEELTHLSDGTGTVQVTQSPAANPAFDVTPARLVTAYITERGVLDRI